MSLPGQPCTSNHLDRVTTIFQSTQVVNLMTTIQNLQRRISIDDRLIADLKRELADTQRESADAQHQIHQFHQGFPLLMEAADAFHEQVVRAEIAASNQNAETAATRHKNEIRELARELEQLKAANRKSLKCEDGDRADTLAMLEAEYQDELVICVDSLVDVVVEELKELRMGNLDVGGSSANSTQCARVRMPPGSFQELVSMNISGYVRSKAVECIEAIETSFRETSQTMFKTQAARQTTKSCGNHENAFRKEYPAEALLPGARSAHTTLIHNMIAESSKHDAQVSGLQDACARLRLQHTQLGGSVDLIPLPLLQRVDAVSSICHDSKPWSIQLELEARRATQTQNIRLLDKYRRSLHNQNLQLRGNIRSILRVRPLGNANANALVSLHFPGFEHTEVEITTHENVRGQGNKVRYAKRKWSFDEIFDADATNEDIFANAVEPLIQSALDGYPVCIVAYGQTGSGKTFTMTCPQDPSEGIISRAVKRLFDGLSQSTIKVSLSCFEIYKDKVYECLDGSGNVLQLQENNELSDLIRRGINRPAQVQHILQHVKRKTANTKKNTASSRSHLVYRITLMKEDSVIAREEATQEQAVNIRKKPYSSINLVDLAGSEALGVAEDPSESKSINKSLLVLCKCLRALGGTHVPFRDSMLTKILQPSLTGDAKVLMLFHISSLECDLRDTKATLDMGQYVRTKRPGNGVKSMSRNGARLKRDREDDKRNRDNAK